MVVGISGVGKTTFIRNLNKELSFQHLTAGSLIATARSATNEGRDSLRLANVDENQSLLIRGFGISRDPEADLILLDGHVVIHGDNGLKQIPSETFRALGVSGFLHIVASASRIQQNRSSDVTRKRPLLSLAELEAHQADSLNVAANVAKLLDVPWTQVSYEDLTAAREFIGGVAFPTPPPSAAPR